MTNPRWLPALVLTATLSSGPAFGQFDPRPLGYPGVGRTVPAAGYHDPGTVPSVMPATGRLDSRTNPIERVSMNSIPGSDPSEPLPPGVPPLPMASVQPGYGAPAQPPGPWLADRAGCCGPVGANGPVTYELYLTTGINYVSGSDLTDRLNPGVVAGGGGRSFLYDRDGTAAWTIDLGITYTWNRGIQDDTMFVLDKGQIEIDPIFGTETVIPPSLKEVRLRGLYRTSFNYALGRDCWLWGPGVPGYETGWNLRWGALVGGRWGTAHVDLIPVNEENGYMRTQATFLSAYFDIHMDWEIPCGGWILFGGFAAQYGHDWMNIIAPLDSEIDNVNIMMTGGFRF